jgi:hypothetical protein
MYCGKLDNNFTWFCRVFILKNLFIVPRFTHISWPHARYWWNCSLQMVPWTLSLQWRFIIYHLYVLWEAEQQLYMVLHSIHPQKPIHCAEIYSYFTAPPKRDVWAVSACWFGLRTSRWHLTKPHPSGKSIVALLQDSITRRLDQVNPKDSDEQSQPSQRSRLENQARASLFLSSRLVVAKYRWSRDWSRYRMCWSSKAMEGLIWFPIQAPMPVVWRV